MIVIKVHTERAGNLGRLYPIAPNPDRVNTSTYLTLSLASLGNKVKQRMEDLTDSNQRYALLSFAMFARAYRLPKRWVSARNRNTPAEKGVIMEYRMVCRNTNIVKDPLYADSSYVANTTNKFVAIFDTTQNVKDMIANRKKYHIPAKFGGIMAYRVDMDDYAGSCGEGVFPRLGALKSELLK
ncbi:uncharacterized protein [Dermacentor andersoni]|uniref:uncharacterized protein n=1 Tax=Dermacentor andersoni TaxID=34620 RepID=UPI00241646FD|nr:uncharacterized protein LOC129385382 [Dermacentor andersoni]